MGTPAMETPEKEGKWEDTPESRMKAAEGAIRHFSGLKKGKQSAYYRQMHEDISQEIYLTSLQVEFPKKCTANLAELVVYRKAIDRLRTAYGLLSSRIHPWEKGKPLSDQENRAICFDLESIEGLANQYSDLQRNSSGNGPRVPPDGMEGIREVEFQDLWKATREGLYTLPERDREVVMLYYGLEGRKRLNGREIEEKLKAEGERIGKQTIWYLLRRSLQRLRRMLGY